MGDYYGNAQITIAASCAPNAQAGILSPRPGISKPSKEEFPVTDGTLCTVLVQERRRQFEECDKLVPNFGPLSERGWAFQENILSGRTVHYTQSELLWECCTETISEDGLSLENQHSLLARNLLELQLSPDRLWQDLVTYYSRRKLTYYSDRLPGIAGLALMLQK